MSLDMTVCSVRKQPDMLWTFIGLHRSQQRTVRRF
jgi:hypothetical protein